MFQLKRMQLMMQTKHPDGVFEPSVCQAQQGTRWARSDPHAGSSAKIKICKSKTKIIWPEVEKQEHELKQEHEKPD